MKTALVIGFWISLTLLHAQTGVTLPTLNISPQFVANLGPANNETSGLVYFHDTLFSINDSGNAPALFAIDPLTGATLHTWAFLNAQNIDWEALAASNSKIFIGDIGNNMGTRSFFEIYQVLSEYHHSLKLILQNLFQVYPLYLLSLIYQLPIVRLRKIEKFTLL